MESKKIISIVIKIILIVLVLFGGYLVYKKFIYKDKPGAMKIKELDNIEKYEYVLLKNKSKLYKDYFEELKKTLNEKPVKEEDYVSKIAKLFAVDFYNLDEKLTNNDIGGLSFVHPDIVDNFTLKASDTIYSHIESNVKNDRKQVLPKVKSVEVKSTQKSVIQIGTNKDQEGYIVNVLIHYEQDLGFPTSVQLKMVHKDIKLYIIEIK